MRTLYKILKTIFLVMDGLLITILSINASLSGVEVLGNINCGIPSGLPFAFVGTWKGAASGNPFSNLNPGCFLDADIVALVLNVIFWSLTLFVVIKLFGVLVKKLSAGETHRSRYERLFTIIFLGTILVSGVLYIFSLS